MVGGSLTTDFPRRPQAVENSPLPASGPRLGSENTYCKRCVRGRSPEYIYRITKRFVYQEYLRELPCT